MEENKEAGSNSNKDSGSTGERGLLTDLAIFAVIVGLALAAIYFSGNWPWFLKTVANLESEFKDFANMFMTNIQSVTDVARNAPQL